MELLKILKIAKSVISNYNPEITEEGSKSNSSVVNDVVTNVDLSTEQKIKDILKGYPEIFGAYGEEYGFELFHTDGTRMAVIDPIDGTRAFAGHYAYSSISVGFYDREGGDCNEGILININNQIPEKYRADKYTIYVYSYGNVYVSHDLAESWQGFAPAIEKKALSDCMVAITDNAKFGTNYTDEMVPIEVLRKFKEKLLSTSRGQMGFFSGAAEIMCTLTGSIGLFINLCPNDVVSHPVAIAIARACGAKVIHVATEGDDFRIGFNKDGKPFFLCGDGTVMVSAAVDPSVVRKDWLEN